MINEILDFSRLEACEMTYLAVPFHLAQTCQQVLDLLRPLDLWSVQQDDQPQIR